MKSFTIRNDLYRCSYMVFISKRDEYLTELDKLGYDTSILNPYNELNGATVNWSDGVISVWFNDDNNKILISDIAHEAVHVALFTCDYIGIGVSTNGDDHETPAYIITFFIEELLKNLKKRDFIQL